MLRGCDCEAFVQLVLHETLPHQQQLLRMRNVLTIACRRLAARARASSGFDGCMVTIKRRLSIIDKANWRHACGLQRTAVGSCDD